MKKFIVILLFLTLIFLVGYTFMKVGGNNTSITEEVFLPITHQSHTHEHEGVSCCPCGGCHKKENGEDYHAEVTWYARLTACITVLVFLFSQLHEVIPMLFG